LAVLEGGFGKSLNCACDIQDQLAGLCKCVEVIVGSNLNVNDIMLIQNKLGDAWWSCDWGGGHGCAAACVHAGAGIIAVVVPLL